MNNTFQINSCEVCGNQTLTPVLDLGSHPICDELIPVGASETNELYSINIHYCEKCYTAHFRIYRQTSIRDINVRAKWPASRVYPHGNKVRRGLSPSS